MKPVVIRKPAIERSAMEEMKIAVLRSGVGSLSIAAPSEPVKAIGTKGRIDQAIAPPVTIVEGKTLIRGFV